MILLNKFTKFAEYQLTGKTHPNDTVAASNILCYECDSRYDPNCADPFDFSLLSTPQYVDSSNQTTGRQPTDSRQQSAATPNVTALNQTVKKLPNAAVCHGCCVKITSKTTEGGGYLCDHHSLANNSNI